MSLTAIALKGALRVLEARDLNSLVRLIRLGSPTGTPLPNWDPGAHILVRVQLPDGREDWRHYSLIDLEGVVHKPNREVSEYTIAVRLDENGRGGSQYMHTLQRGDLLSVEGPKNNFFLDVPEGVTRLLAGGIGITPLSSMASYCRAHRHDVELYYSGRSRSLMAFAGELSDLLGDDLHIHADDESDGNFFNVEELLDRCEDSDRLFVCGPRPMLNAVLDATEKRGWEVGRVCFEIFDEPKTEDGDLSFEVELADSGETLTVQADQTILDCLVEHGYDPLYDCARGECGVCSVGVLGGDIDHRDYYLSQDEKDSGEIMQICVSRAKGKKLILDM